MGNQFNWQFDEEDAQEKSATVTPSRRRMRRWLVLAGISAVILTAFWLVRTRLLSAEAALTDSAQALVDREQEAFLAGDGERLFTEQLRDPAWQAAQLHPDLQAQRAAGLTITQAQLREEMVWANATWQHNGEPLQRVVFFLQQPGGRLIHVASDPAYWGEVQQHSAEWGTLHLHEADANLANSIVAHVSNVIAKRCAIDPCRDFPPLTIHVSDQWQDSAEVNTIRLPSPRLTGINASGQPDARFWQQLSQRVNAHIAPVTLRVAVPTFRDQHLDYATAARAFMANHPHIHIELVEVDELPTGDALNAFDVVAFAPSAEIVAAGLVRDLTFYAETDERFQPTDFYEQIRQGAIWRDRLWFVPLAAEMRLFYLDDAAYDRLGQPLPEFDWTWDDLMADSAALKPLLPTTFGLMDSTESLTFAHAMNQQPRCDLTTGSCTQSVSPTAVNATRDWLAALTTTGIHPNWQALDADGRDLTATRLQSIPRRTAIWVGSPLRYEHLLQLGALSPRPFPRAADADAPTTPLWVEGAFIPQGSATPDQAWEWLLFLSHAPLLREFRLIPARPSRALDTNYWYTLPEELGRVQRAVFEQARPVPLADRGRIDWNSAEATTPLRWFNP